MNLQSMNLQTFINQNKDNYIDLFKQEKLVYRKYPKLNLLVVKRKYGTDFSTDKSWLNYCRGAIIDYSNHKVVLVPPVKSTEIRTKEEFMSPVLIDDEYQYLIDGTMINMFYHNNEWLVSTRSNIGATNKWNKTMTFKDMFNECSTKVDYDTLNTKYTYSFVMRHTKNKIISPVDKNELILVEVYEMTDAGLVYIPMNKYREQVNSNVGFTIIPSYSHDTFKDSSELNKGYTKKTLVNGTIQRTRWITTDYKFQEMIKPNTNNPNLNYLLLRKNGHLVNYLTYNPEMRHEFEVYRANLHMFSQSLYNIYVNVFIHKTMEKELIPFSMKPFIYEIHKSYLETKQSISWEKVKNYIYELEPKRLMFALNNINL